MFETTGQITESLMKEISWYLVGRLKKVGVLIAWIIFLAMTIFSFYGRDYKYAILSLVLCIVIPIAFFMSILKNAKLYFEKMKAVNAGLEVTTSFMDDGVRVKRNSKSEMIVKYESISKFVETKNTILLITRSNQFVVAFKNNLNNKEELISFLKTKIIK